MHINSLMYSAVVFLGIGVVGCVPMAFRYQTQPAVAGVVVDATDQSPVSGAEVSTGGGSAEYRESDSVSRRQTKSGRDGSFKFPAKYRWHFYVYSPASQTKGLVPTPILGGWLEVEHDGFEIYVVEIPRSLARYDVVIPLKRASE
jgi:hypothetical protein